MGMAASQARYLGLTARKTNVEYEGQQINQARTALANQSASLFNQLLGLSVPSVPDVIDYTETQYSFSDGFNNFVINDMQRIDDPDYNYIVKYSYYEDVIQGVEEINTSPQAIPTSVRTYNNTQNTINTVSSTEVVGEGGRDEYDVVIGANNVRYIPCDITDAEALVRINGTLGTSLAVGNTYKHINADGTIDYTLKSALEDELPTIFPKNIDYYSSTVASEATYSLGNSTAAAVDLTNPLDAAALAQIVKDNPDSAFATNYAAGDTIYKFKKAGVEYYASEAEILASFNSAEPSGTLNNQVALRQYYSMQQSKEVSNEQKALLDDTSGTGRFNSVKFENSNAVFNLNSETVTNKEGYNQAMNQYNYDVMVYEKKISDINAKTKSIQEQDRTLELRLKQLDTEQDALSNEMEAVKKVIEKNVESTFKTFS